ncbi:hypothetical protein RRG08_032191 [Elysia crispata]|uniref:Uncharacterized protein n=1 Tax=Elysia crispata TaxID=231223 RepID=A0AAE1DX39_9GAST|nr:hypothetical protein RRG08_032191 [Elysia crispata]
MGPRCSPNTRKKENSKAGAQPHTSQSRGTYRLVKSRFDKTCVSLRDGDIVCGFNRGIVGEWAGPLRLACMTEDCLILLWLWTFVESSVDLTRMYKYDNPYGAPVSSVDLTRMYKYDNPYGAPVSSVDLTRMYKYDNPYGAPVSSVDLTRMYKYDNPYGAPVSSVDLTRMYKYDNPYGAPVSSVDLTRMYKYDNPYEAPVSSVGSALDWQYGDSATISGLVWTNIASFESRLTILVPVLMKA